MAKKLDKPALASNYVWFMLVTLLIFVVAFALMLGGIHGSNFQEHGALIQVITFFLAFMPILLVLIGMIGFDLSALKVAPFAFLLAVLLSYTFFANMEHGPVELGPRHLGADLERHQVLVLHRRSDPVLLPHSGPHADLRRDGHRQGQAR